SSSSGIESSPRPPLRQSFPSQLCLPRLGPLPLSLPGAGRTQYTCRTSLNAPFCVQRLNVESLFERVLSHRTRRGASFLIALHGHVPSALTIGRGPLES